MTEEFLQFVWEQKLFEPGKFKLVSGEKLEIVETGTRNGDSGPDFFNAKIKIEDTLWAGNVEIHKSSSDWKRHLHQNDGAYDNIILHVVHRYDEQVLRSNGEEIPTLILPFPAYLLSNYRQLIESTSWIPCQQRFRVMDPFVLKIGFNRLMIERLQEKTSEIAERLKQNSYDWNETFYQFMARNFGFRTNAVPFELLAKSLPVHLLSKHKDNLFQLEALLFGQSGLLHLELLGDDYFIRLRNEYDFLSKKYHLKPLAGHLWKFLRLRPLNFPTIRIAQFARLFHTSSGLFSLITETPTLREIKGKFDVETSAYWINHYRFNQPAKKRAGRLGESACTGLIINSVIPFMFVYGEQTGRHFLKDRALEWLDQLPPEDNSIITKWKELGAPAESAFESQALLQLKNSYCDKKKCLHCHVGSKLIRSH